MNIFYCHQCQSQIFFVNTFCSNCQCPVGYIATLQSMMSFKITDDGWQALDGSEKIYYPCKNYQNYQVCNWMVEANSEDDLCHSCQLTQVIPSLHETKNLEYWAKLEIAKRRFLYITQRFNIFPSTKKHPDDHLGLSFHFLVPTDDQPVLTGHANGVITLNAFEADSVYRETTRVSMGEHYRTLLGHFRHESGHFYFDMLIKDTLWIEPFRELFGDERQDYTQALHYYYHNGAVSDWQTNYISAYASSHPWEDWAESWAHYLHMMSTLDTAYYSGISMQKKQQVDPELTFYHCPIGNQDFDLTIKNWFALTYALNALNRSMGLEDAYPFTLSNQILKKLNFIHNLLLTVLDQTHQHQHYFVSCK